MDILKRRIRGERREFSIYSQAEADEAGIKYVHWKEAQPGDWALSDDGYVGECLFILGPYRSRSGGFTATHMVFSYGRIFNYPTAKLNFLDHKATNSYTRVSTKGWAEMEAKSTRGKRFIMAVVADFITGDPVDWEKLGLIYRPDQKGRRPDRTAKKLFRQEIFQKMIQQKMIEVFKDRSVTENDVIDMFNDALKVAKANKDAKEIRKVAEDFRDMLDMNPKELPRGGEIPPHIEDAVVEELQADIDKAQIGLGQKKIEAGETKGE